MIRELLENPLVHDEIIARLPLALAVLLLAVSAFLYMRTRTSRLISGLYLVILVILVVMTVAYVAADLMTGQGITEGVFYHVFYGLAGAGFREYLDVMLISGGLLLALSVGLTAFVWKYHDRGRPGGWRAWLIPALASLALLPHPTTRSLQAYFAVDPGAMIGVRPAQPAQEEASNRRAFAAHYAATPKRLRAANLNVVFIHAESLEQTYFDEQLFPGLMRRLRRLRESASWRFTDIRQVPGTGWTIAGLVAAHCGIPLLIPSDAENSMAGADRFLPGATCLGDVLKRDGYHLVFMNGASLAFAGAGKFFRTHGFHEIIGRKALEHRLNDPGRVSAWGIYDDMLLEEAWRKYQRLAARRAPFLLSILTLDTHHPRGHATPACRTAPDRGDPMLNAVACADVQLSRFIERIRSSPAGRETIIVVASDHLAMRNTVWGTLTKGRRRNLFFIIDPRQRESRAIGRTGSTLDIGATLLQLLGYEGRIGLGRSLLDPAFDEERATILANLPRWRRPLQELWRFPSLQAGLTIDPGQRRLVIDGRALHLPALLAVDEDLRVRFAHFDPGLFWESKVKLVDAAGRYLKAGRPFLLIDKCRRIRLSPAARGTCLMAGAEGKMTAVREVIGPIRLSAADLRALMRMTEEKAER